MTSEDRKKAAKEARLRMKAAAKETPVVHFYGKLNDWRHVNGGVKILEDEEDEQTVAEQEAMLDELYQQVLARKMQKVVEGNKKEVEEFAQAMKKVKGQIILMKEKEARMRKRARVKHPNGVLISGDVIEKTVGYVPDEQRKQEQKASAFRLASIVTIKIEAGESVRVQIKNTDMTRTEHGPQVLILASTEQLIASTFPLTKRNISFKPEFTWTLTPTFKNTISDPSFSSFSSSSHDFFDSHASPSFSSHTAPSFSSHTAPSSYSFHAPSSTSSYSLPDDSSFSPSYSYSFDDSPSTHGYDFVDDSIGKLAYDFDAQVVSESGNIYSFDDEYAYQNGNVFSFGDGYGEEVEEKIPEVRLQEFTDLASEVTRVKGVYSEGFMSEADYNRTMTELAERIGVGSHEDLEAELQTRIDEVRREIEQRRIVAKIDSDSEGEEPGSPKISKQQQKRNAKAAARGRGAANRGGGPPNRGRGAFPNRGGPPPNRGGGPPNRGRGAFPNRGGPPSRGRGGFPNQGDRPARDGPPPPRGGFRGRGGTARGRGGPRRFVVREEDADNFSDVSSVISHMSDYYAPVASETDQKLSMCEELLEYLRRYLPKEAKKGKSSKSGNGESSKNGKDEDDYLSSSFFLTDEEEGYYYEKEQERRKQKKKKTKKAKKTLYHPTRIFTFFGLLETFPPITLIEVPASIQYIENFKDKLLREQEEKKAKEEEQLRLDLEKEEERAQERESVYSTSISASALSSSLAPDDAESNTRYNDDNVFSERDDATIFSVAKDAGEEEEGDFGGLDFDN